ncbi:hypothetical protein V9T40_007921 [Parthenolecanium corni]|uniref:Uncharacterized protein n=1 Tax=Parthenolecanium corni TaxID=536013 RepID=A0AAN9TP53_9HEMI
MARRHSASAFNTRNQRILRRRMRLGAAALAVGTSESDIYFHEIARAYGTCACAYYKGAITRSSSAEPEPNTRAHSPSTQMIRVKLVPVPSSMTSQDSTNEKKRIFDFNQSLSSNACDVMELLTGNTGTK